MAIPFPDIRLQWRSGGTEKKSAIVEVICLVYIVLACVHFALGTLGIIGGIFGVALCVLGFYGAWKKDELALFWYVVSIAILIVLDVIGVILVIVTLSNMEVQYAGNATYDAVLASMRGSLAGSIILFVVTVAIEGYAAKLAWEIRRGIREGTAVADQAPQAEGGYPQEEVQEQPEVQV